MSTEEQKANLFNLTIGNEEENVSVEGRADAVAKAKSLSQETNQRVSLERADGMVSMQFSDGVLETYVCETREKKPARRKVEQTEGQNEEQNEESETQNTEEAVVETVEKTEEADL